MRLILLIRKFRNIIKSNINIIERIISINEELSKERIIERTRIINRDHVLEEIWERKQNHPDILFG